MSCSERRAVLLGLLALGGCGFRPLYGGGTEGGGAGGLLGRVRLETDGDEFGFHMRDALIRKLRPAGANAPLVLRVTSQRVRRPVLVEGDDVVTRYNLQVSARYSLFRRGAAPSAEPLASGEEISIVAFNATPSQYATLVAERQILGRAASEVAAKITNRLASAYQPGWLG